MRSSSNSFAPFILLLVAACARPAPPLPPAGTAPDPPPALNAAERMERCTTLAREISALREDMAAIESVILGRRGRDQAAAYLAAMLFPPMLSQINQQKARKQALDERQAAVDRRLTEQKGLACPSAL